MLIYVKSKRLKQTLSLDTLNIRRNKTICQFEGMKLDRRNYLDLNEKTCLRGSDHARLKPTYSVTEISQNAEILRIASL